MRIILIGDRLKNIREGKGLTLKVFAELLSTSPGFLSEVENGRKKPGYELLFSLKQIFDVDINWFLTGKEKRKEAGEVGEVVEASPVYKSKPTVKDLIDQHLEQMDAEAQRDVLKYTAEKKQLTELLKERRKEG